MARPVKPKAPTVIISPHAHERWLERAGRKPTKKKDLASLIKTLLYSRMQADGVEIKKLSLKLDLGGGVWAVLRLGELGWICTTVMDELGEEEAG